MLSLLTGALEQVHLIAILTNLDLLLGKMKLLSLLMRLIHAEVPLERVSSSTRAQVLTT